MELKLCYALYILPIVCQSFGKTPFRSCGEHEPCDTNFYCSMPFMFCSPCKDLCVEKFMAYCQHYCAGYLKDSKLAYHPSLSKDSLIVLESLLISETPKSFLDSAMLPSTAVTRFIRRETSVTYKYYEIESENNIFNSRSLWFILTAVIIAVALIGAYWLLKRKMQRCQQAKHAYVDNGYIRTSTEGKNGHWASHSCSQHSYYEVIDINTPKILNPKANITMKCDSSCA